MALPTIKSQVLNGTLSMGRGRGPTYINR